MSLPRVFVTRKVHEKAIQHLKEKCLVDIWDSDKVVPRAELLKRIHGASAIFCTISDNIDVEALDNAGPSLKIVSTMSVGTHHINTFECKRRGIYVSNTPDVASDSAAEFTVTLLLMVARRCLEGEQAVKDGQWGLWKPMWICGSEIINRTLGIIGFGRVGFGVARRLKPFGLTRILYTDVAKASMGDDLGAEFVKLDTLLQESDYVVVTCALTGLTRHLLNHNAFKKMKPSAVLINTSRGPVVNTLDLVEALQSKQIAGAGLDVTDPEPLPKEHPLVQMENCIITPHLATNTNKAREAMALNAALNITSHIYFDSLQ